MLSTVLIASIAVVVVVVENRARKAFNEPVHRRVMLTPYLRILLSCVNHDRTRDRTADSDPDTYCTQATAQVELYRYAVNSVAHISHVNHFTIMQYIAVH